MTTYKINITKPDGRQVVEEVNLLQYIGHRVRQRREYLGISQSELALRADVDRFTINHLELGQKSTLIIKLEAICQPLGLTVGDIFPSKPPPTDKQPIQTYRDKAFGRVKCANCHFTYKQHQDNAAPCDDFKINENYLYHKRRKAILLINKITKTAKEISALNPLLAFLDSDNANIVSDEGSRILNSYTHKQLSHLVDQNK